jgi:gluconokinase
MVIVVMGVSGSGKSTVGRRLAERCGGSFADADAYHPERNVKKMAGGIPLTEEDRQPWLRALRDAIQGWLEGGGLHVLACSALTEASRRQLGIDGDRVRLVFLHGSFEVIHARMKQRAHFMPPELLQSQFDTLEPPRDALRLDVTQTVDQVVEAVMAAWDSLR